DALDIQFRQLLDKGQHRIQFVLQMWYFCVGDRDPGEMRDTANGGGIDRHDIWPLNGEFSPPYSRGCFCTATAAKALLRRHCQERPPRRPMPSAGHPAQP